AGAADLLVHAAVAVSALAGSRALGAQPALSDWPAVAVFLASFSFLYTVVPLAFWGQTLGMTWAGLLSRSHDGEALSFDQTARLWLGGLLTATTLGLPLFLTGSGRSLADRLSGADTYLSG
ncbi:MAG TPA: RDD family protein, partial [Thermoanaerobaculia bacterium]|nr:RDD family protein [Thermoanaerobaculia bacterium]